jgi:periplasmic protein TonB
MTGLAAEDIVDLRRWAICAAVVVLAHGGIAAAMVTWHQNEGGSAPASGIVIEFAPVPLAPSTHEAEVAPGPLQEASQASPNKPVETLEEREKVEQKVKAKLKQNVEEKVAAKALEEPQPDVAPAPNPDVAIQPPPQEVKQETVMRQAPSLGKIAAAPQVIAQETSAIPVAPAQGEPNPINSAAVQSWHKQIVALIQRHARHPPDSRSRGWEGRVVISFSLDRQGRVIDRRVLSSSGVAALDEAALATLRRAQPFPPPPADVPGERINKDVPINFFLRR